MLARRVDDDVETIAHPTALWRVIVVHLPSVSFGPVSLAPSPPACIVRSWWFAAAGLALTACAAFSQVVKVVTEGDKRTLRALGSDTASNSPSRSTLLILAVDGIGRDLLYSMLTDEQLPELAALLGKGHAVFTHAYFAPEVLTIVPSTTGVAWASMFTGVAPAEHGFSGNEFFVREKHQFLCAPTIYETMRKQDPNIDIWVSMSQFYNGADRLLMTRRGVLGSALEAFLAGHTEKNLPRAV